MKVSPATVDAMDVFLGRMEKTIASRVGAGATLDEAWEGERWRREMAADVAVPDVVDGLLVAVRGQLGDARTARAVHDAFARMRSRLAAVAAVDESDG